MLSACSASPFTRAIRASTSSATTTIPSSCTMRAVAAPRSASSRASSVLPISKWIEEIERAAIVRDGAVELAAVVERDRDAHVALRREAQFIDAAREIQRRAVRLHRFCGPVQPAIRGAKRDKDACAKTGIADLVPLHRVARRLERFCRGDVLTDLSVRDATEMQEVRDLGGVRRRVD